MSEPLFPPTTRLPWAESRDRIDRVGADVGPELCPDAARPTRTHERESARRQHRPVGRQGQLFVETSSGSMSPPTSVQSAPSQSRTRTVPDVALAVAVSTGHNSNSAPRPTTTTPAPNSSWLGCAVNVTSKLTPLSAVPLEHTDVAGFRRGTAVERSADRRPRSVSRHRHGPAGLIASYFTDDVITDLFEADVGRRDVFDIAGHGDNARTTTMKAVKIRLAAGPTPSLRVGVIDAGNSLARRNASPPNPSRMLALTLAYLFLAATHANIPTRA